MGECDSDYKIKSNLLLPAGPPSRCRTERGLDQSPGWLALPAATAVISYVADSKVLDHLEGITGFKQDSQKWLFRGVRYGADLVTTLTYTNFHQRLNPWWALIGDVGYGAVGIDMVVTVLKGKGGDSELNFGIQAGLNIAAANGYKFFGEKWGAILEGGLGLTAIGLGALVVKDVSSAIKERGISVDPKKVTSHYNVSNNPFEVPFPQLKTNLYVVGTVHIISAALQGGLSLYYGESREKKVGFQVRSEMGGVTFLLGGAF